MGFFGVYSKFLAILLAEIEKTAFNKSINQLFYRVNNTSFGGTFRALGAFLKKLASSRINNTYFTIFDCTPAIIHVHVYILVIICNN